MSSLEHRVWHTAVLLSSLGSLRLVTVDLGQQGGDLCGARQVKGNELRVLLQKTAIAKLLLTGVGTIAVISVMVTVAQLTCFASFIGRSPASAGGSPLLWMFFFYPCVCVYMHV